MITRKNLRDQIRKDLELDGDLVSESYVSQPKEYEHNTDLLSKKAKIAHEELYKGYIEKLNKISAQLDTVDRANANSGASAYRALKHAEMFNRNAVYLHELHFANIGDVNSEISYDSLTYMRLARDFGSFDDWQWDFIACAKSASNGWAVCAYDTFLMRYVNFFIEGHDVNIPIGCYPILVLDTWEHAYFRDYLNDRETYINNMMREFNWRIVEERVRRPDVIHKVVGS